MEQVDLTVVLQVGPEVEEDWEGKQEKGENEKEEGKKGEEKEEERKVLMVGGDMKGEEKVVLEVAVE